MCEAKYEFSSSIIAVVIVVQCFLQIVPMCYLLASALANTSASAHLRWTYIYITLFDNHIIHDKY